MALPPRSNLRTMFTYAALAALIWAIGARMAGPADIWNQTQPRTVSYTTDIIVHGGAHWILPREQDAWPATKPPLYNWLAVPFVRVLGFSSEIAHKAPSVLALVGCFVMVVTLGNRIDDGRAAADDTGRPAPVGRRWGEAGWLAGLCLASNYAMFKLGFLARPDMLLTLLLFIAWWSATMILAKKGDGSLFHVQKRAGDCPPPRKKGSRPLFLFWSCVALAGLAKGPPAFLAIIYAAVAARVFGGSWRTVHRLRWWWGLPAVVLVVGAWVVAVWRIDPDHLTRELWHNEIYGRITGQAATTDYVGPADWLIGLPSPIGHFVSRFFPWSIAATLMLIWLARRRRPEGPRNVHSIPAVAHPWIIGATVYLLVVIGFFALSAGKRADYIAPALPPASLLAAWWLLRCPPRIAARQPHLIVLTAAVTLGALTWANQVQLDSNAPTTDFSANISRFITAASHELAARPAPVGFQWTMRSHLKAYLGFSEPDSPEKIAALIERGRPFWVIAGLRYKVDEDFRQWCAVRHPLVTVTAIVRSDPMPENDQPRWWMFNREWPGRVTLYRLVPPPRDPANP